MTTYRWFDITSDTKPMCSRLLATAIACLIVGALGACSDLPRSIARSVRASVTGGPALPVSPTEVAQRPLFQVLAKTQHGNALLILGNVDGAREAWYGPGHTALFLDHGRIVKTANLESDLVASRVIGSNPFETGLQHIETTAAFDSVDDWSPGYRFGVPVHSDLIRIGMEAVDILEKPHQLLRVDERRRSEAGGWAATNHFWVDPQTGFIWKSQQYAAPGLEIEIVQLKPRLQAAP